MSRKAQDEGRHYETNFFIHLNIKMGDNRDYINSKMECPICALLFAKNYLLVHLKRHSNIWGTPQWEGSRYAKNFERIKADHKKKWGKKN